MNDTDVQAINTDCKPKLKKIINLFFVNEIDPGTCHTCSLLLLRALPSDSMPNRHLLLSLSVTCERQSVYFVKQIVCLTFLFLL